MKARSFVVALAVSCALAPNAAQAQVFDRSVPVNGAATLRLNASGHLHLMPVAGQNDVRVHAVDYGPKLPALNFSVTRTGSRLTVTITGPSRSLLPFVGATGYELDVTYPESLKIDVRQFSGLVDVDRITAPSQIYDANGDIHVVDARAPLTAEADSGEIVVRAAHGNLELTAGEGNATATLANDWSGNMVRMEASNGNLTLNAPAGLRAHFDVNTASGTVANAFHDTPKGPLVFMLAEKGNIVLAASPK